MSACARPLELVLVLDPVETLHLHITCKTLGMTHLPRLWHLLLAVVLYRKQQACKVRLLY